MATKKRNDSVVRVSRWLDEAVKDYISEKKVSIEFPSKRNFIDKAVMKLLEEKKVNLGV